MTRILYLDPAGGASGDMVAGALLDLGLDAGELQAALVRVTEGRAEIRLGRVRRSGAPKDSRTANHAQ